MNNQVTPGYCTFALRNGNMSHKLSTDRRIELLSRLGAYMNSEDEAWIAAKEHAVQANVWFTAEHVTLAVANITEQFLQKDNLAQWINHYQLPDTYKTVGIVMAGNIPLVGFHDLVCGFMSGHKLMIKLSSKDDVLMRHLIGKLTGWEPETADQVQIAERLNNCDAYIATGSNNTSRYFEEYFGKYPHIIRKNRTSVAVLDGDETDEELGLLADDIYHYYGLGCRNVSQICVPANYDFARLLNVFNKHNRYADLNKYKHNYDYHLAIYLLNKVPYMSNESLLMVENATPFSAVSVLHYRYYDNKEKLVKELEGNDDIQAIIGRGHIPFGDSQKPGLGEYADGIDTMAFLCGL